MTEKKDTTTPTTQSKLAPTAKEFIPKEKKSIDKPETREARSGSLSLNPAAKEFVPKMASPAMGPAPAPVVFVPAYYPEGALAEGTFFVGFLVTTRDRGKEEAKRRTQTQYLSLFSSLTLFFT